MKYPQPKLNSAIYIDLSNSKVNWIDKHYKW